MRPALCDLLYTIGIERMVTKFTEYCAIPDVMDDVWNLAVIQDVTTGSLAMTKLDWNNQSQRSHPIRNICWCLFLTVD